MLSLHDPLLNKVNGEIHNLHLIHSPLSLTHSHLAPACHTWWKREILLKLVVSNIKLRQTSKGCFPWVFALGQKHFFSNIIFILTLEHCAYLKRSTSNIFEKYHHAPGMSRQLPEKVVSLRAARQCTIPQEEANFFIYLTRVSLEVH